MFELTTREEEIKIDGFNSIYYFEFGKNFTHPPERHDFWEFVYVDSGSIMAVTDGVATKLSQGQIIFHEPNEPHSHISDNEVSNNMLVISFTTHSPAMSFFAKKIFTLDKTSKTLLTLFAEEAKNALGEIPGDYKKKEALDFSSAKFGSAQLLTCFLTEFLIRLIRSGTQMGSKIVQSEENRTIAQTSIAEMIVEYMNENLHKNLTLRDICSHFMLEKSQLSHIFKNNIGTSVIGYYNKLKIKEAKRLLRNGDLTVSQISDMLGYSCIHTFSRAFKAQVNCSPTEYKNKVWYQ